MKILVLVASYFPYGVAISTRMVNFCRLFSDMGNDVHVISLYSKQDIKANEVNELEYCTYQVATNKAPSSKASFFGEVEFTKSIEEYMSQNKIDLVFSSGIEPYFNKVVKLCKKYRVPLYLEQCEWVDISSYRFGKFDYRFIRRNNLISKGYRSVDGIISISNLLKNYFQSLNIRTVRIPTILDVSNIKPEYNTYNEKIVLVYTGNPSTSKEYLGPIIKLLANNECFRRKFEFNIYGPSREKVIANIDGAIEMLDKTKECVIIHGQVPQEQMELIQKQADFQIFIRPNRRSSNAGFPTKLGESMAVGTPVITNKTGDIAQYLRDGKNGFLMENGSEEELSLVLEHIAGLSDEQYSQLRKAARETAEEHFDFRKYYKEIDKLFGWNQNNGV